MASPLPILMALLLPACTTGSGETEGPAGDTGAKDTGSNARWWEEVPDIPFQVHVEGMGQDRDYSWDHNGGHDIGCSRISPPTPGIEFGASDVLDQGLWLMLCTYESGDVSLQGDDFFEVGSGAECSTYAAWAGQWKWNPDTSLPYQERVYTRPLSAEEQADCSLDAHMEGDELTGRFDCSWFRQQYVDDDPVSLVGTFRCTVPSGD